MFVLARYPGESIKIGDDIRITVEKIVNKQVTLIVKDSVDRTIILGWGESVSISDGIKVTAKSIKNQVKLGIEVPEDVTINREDVPPFTTGVIGW